MTFPAPGGAKKPVNTFSLTLREIASWHDNPEITQKSEVRASVPVLQRGLVWDPSQIELLWDSILRAFPIGALVLTNKIAGQTKEAEAMKAGITHHLLDGQQRCDAIALGYRDPFRACRVQEDEKCEESILWLDLDPPKDEWSTRDFLVRLTTSSHPWGYSSADDTAPLRAQEIRDALKRIGQDPKVEDYRRPTPTELCPHVANVPVPLAWLLLNRRVDDFWAGLSARLEGAGNFPWHSSLWNFLNDPQKEAQRMHILQALRRTERTEIIALCAPSDLVSGSRQEADSSPQRENISSIEHLFQRLNQKSTRLDGEELAYSMIKAYWPELAGPIDQMAKPMPATRLITLAIRAALVGENRERLPAAQGVSQIRKLAGKQDARTALVYKYISEELEHGCGQLRKWLLYHRTDNVSGLLAVHIASIAHDSPDLFLLLLTFAKRPAADWQIPERVQGQCLQALVTAAHWFGRDKLAIANRVYAACAEYISVGNIRDAVAGAQATGELRPVHSPEAVEAFFNELPATEHLNWNWDQLGHASKSEEERQRVGDKWREFLWFRGQMELLLYAQRNFLFRRFLDYDPARKDYWKGHNRPWDYDHVLAQTYVRSKQGDYKAVCAQWLGTIGNYRAWPMEDNRSEQAESALRKLSNEDRTPKMQQCLDSFLEPEELAAFSHEHETRKKPEAAMAFVIASRKRMLRIYRTWYESVGVGDLMGAADDTAADPEQGTTIATASTSYA